MNNNKKQIQNIFYSLHTLWAGSHMFNNLYDTPRILSCLFTTALLSAYQTN